jgi:hypothetical protein
LVSSGVLPSCTSLDRWPKEPFTGSGIAAMSSLPLAIHMTGFRGKAGETANSSFRHRNNYGKIHIFCQG